MPSPRQRRPSASPRSRNEDQMAEGVRNHILISESSDCSMHYYRRTGLETICGYSRSGYGKSKLVAVCGDQGASGKCRADPGFMHGFYHHSTTYISTTD